MLEKKRSKDEMLMDLTRVLAFGTKENTGLTNIPLGITSIDREFTESKRVYLKEKDNSKRKQLRDLETVLKEFA